MITNYNNHLIIGSLYAILKIDKESKRIVRLGANNGLIDNTARTIFLDKEKKLWIGSDRGVSKIPSMRFLTTTHQMELLNDEVTSIEQIGDIHYIGHNDGISIVKGRDDIINCHFLLAEKALVQLIWLFLLMMRFILLVLNKDC